MSNAIVTDWLLAAKATNNPQAIAKDQLQDSSFSKCHKPNLINHRTFTQGSYSLTAYMVSLPLTRKAGSSPDFHTCNEVGLKNI